MSSVGESGYEVRVIGAPRATEVVRDRPPDPKVARPSLDMLVPIQESGALSFQPGVAGSQVHFGFDRFVNPLKRGLEPDVPRVRQRGLSQLGGQFMFEICSLSLSLSLSLS